ncbi:MAG: DUF362 domain-containing protein [Endomicrobia bacterium]|nr:DUF362 domain-containing protein [Endomicrobiia bacterium]
MTKVSLIKCEDYNKSLNAVKEAVDLLGGISAFVKKGEKILIKPNLLTDRVPDEAVTTHPEVIRAVIRLVKEAGAVPLVGDSPGGAYKERDGLQLLWTKTGMAKVCEEEKVQLVNFEAAGSQDIDIGDSNVKKVHISNAVLNCDGIINVPKLKTHSFMTFTAGVKNFYGCVPGLIKVEYHKMAPKPDQFGALIANIYKYLKPKIRLTVLDGILAMEGSGPSGGDVRKTDMIAASSDAALLDLYLLNILGGDIKGNFTLQKLGITKESFSQIEALGAKPSEFDTANFKFPSTKALYMVPGFVIKILGGFLWIKPSISKDRCVSCMLCVKSCPEKAIDKINGEKQPSVDHKKCISCFCCHEVCPHKAIDLEKSFLAKRFM